MKKVHLILLPVLLIGLLTGYFIGLKQSTKTNELFIKDINGELKPEINNDEKYVYEKTIEDTDNVLFDINNDGNKEEIKLTSTECYRTDNKGESLPVGCAGPICLKPDKYCEGPYKEISYFDSNVSSDKIYVGGFGSGQIKVISFNKEIFIELGNLNLGAHSSETRIFKITKNKIVPVCRENPNLRDKKVDNCVFYSDAGGATLEIHNNSLMALEFFKTDSVMNMIDGEYSSGGITNVYKNGQFVTQR